MKIIRFLFFISVLGTFSSASASVDSIGTEVIEGKVFILHKVEKSEGLYGISKRYKSTVADIQKANNLESTNLALGQILKIPTDKSATTKAQNSTQKKTHIVQRSETLYSISKKYNVTVEQIKQWNSLKNNELSVGQSLLIEEAKNNSGTHPTNTSSNNTESSGSTTDGRKPNKYLGTTEVTENGAVTWISDKNLNPKKSIGLHKTAPIGTIIKVTNKMNNKSVYVKIIGTLPETGDNENIILVVSKAVAAMLDVKDLKFQATLNYSVPK